MGQFTIAPGTLRALAARPMLPPEALLPFDEANARPPLSRPQQVAGQVFDSTIDGLMGLLGLAPTGETKANLVGQLLSAGTPIVAGAKTLKDIATKGRTLVDGAVTNVPELLSEGRDVAKTPKAWQKAEETKRAGFEYLQEHGVKVPIESEAWKQASYLSYAAMKGEIERLSVMPLDQLHPFNREYLKAIGDVAGDRGWGDIVEKARFATAKPSGGTKDVAVFDPAQLRKVAPTTASMTPTQLKNALGDDFDELLLNSPMEPVLENGKLMYYPDGRATRTAGGKQQLDVKDVLSWLTDDGPSGSTSVSPDADWQELVARARAKVVRP